MTAPTHRLLTETRFKPFYWTIFLGSLNDNLLKFAITLVLTYQVSVPGVSPALVGALTGALFVLPSLFFSTLAGAVADRGALHVLIRWGKVFEVMVMLVAAWALLTLSVPVLYGCVLLSGLHVTWFSTLKFAYVPRHLAPAELLGGNALMETGLFTAIVLGTLLGGWLVDPVTLPAVSDGWQPSWRQVALPSLVCLLAVAGWVLSRRIPSTPPLPAASAPADASRPAHAIKDIWRHMAMAASMPAVFRPMVGISWMWFFGSVWMGLFPAIARDVVQAPPSIASSLMVVTAIGIGMGSMGCDVLSRQGLGRHLVLLGAIGMFIFGLDFALALHALEGRPPLVPAGSHALDYLAHWPYGRLALDLGFMSAAMGVFSVPLYARFQTHAPAAWRARLVGANNVLNALLMVLSALWIMALIKSGASVAQVGMATAALQLLVCAVVAKYLNREIQDAE